MKTKEQSIATEYLRALPGVSESRFRILPDVEGWPIIPSRYGRIEYHDGVSVAVFTDRPRLFARLLAVPGMRRHQTGDTEARMLFPADALPQVAQVIGARRRRSPDSARWLAEHAYRATREAENAIGGPETTVTTSEVAGTRA